MRLSIAFNDLINISQDEKHSNDVNVNRHHHYGKHISDLKFKILRDKKTYEKNLQDFNLPPYLRKRNRRYKSIYETMHENDLAKKSKPSPYGHLEYQQLLHKNEIPETDLIAELLQKSMKRIESEHKHLHHKKHHYSRSHHKIKKYRSKPEVGIMQKKLKLVH
jgi:hypothetical protein